MRDGELADMLRGISMLYEAPKKAGFPVRLFFVRGRGECASESSECIKDRLLMVSATWDEYPEVKGYAIPVVGEFLGIVVRKVAQAERERFEFEVRTRPLSGIETCSVIAVSVEEATITKARCAAHAPDAKVDRPH
jgi:hypothetical protein